MAREQHDAISTRYLAGVWLTHLLRQLFWCPAIPRYDPKSSSTTHALNNVLPSWSWASCRKAVSFHQTIAQLQSVNEFTKLSGIELHIGKARKLRAHAAFTYVSTQICPGGLDPFGSIQGRAMHIRGICIDEHISTATLSREECHALLPITTDNSN
jgi:hypothetical protein